MKKQVGLVFSGGGAKGSYQIGVWKALRELGLETAITHVSGTSVGALNASLFSMGAYEQAQQLWASIDASDILDIDSSKFEALATKVETLGIRGTLKQSALGLLGKGRSGGLFSRNRLEEIIGQELDYTAIQNSLVKAYATCFHKKTLSAEYFLLNAQSSEAIRAILLASSAIPIVFESHAVEDQEYFDGGLVDNTPIRPLYDEGVRNFIVVHVSRSGSVDMGSYPGSLFLEIVPQHDMGNLFSGTLNFSQRRVQARMGEGYTDAMELLQGRTRELQEMFGHPL